MKNIDYVIKKTSSDLGLSEEKVRPIIMAYWREATKNIIRLNDTTVSVRHVGNFTVSRFKLYNYIRKLIGKIRRMQTLDTVSDEKRSEILTVYYNDLRKALHQRNILANHYKKMFKKNE